MEPEYPNAFPTEVPTDAGHAAGVTGEREEVGNTDNLKSCSQIEQNYESRQRSMGFH